VVIAIIAILASLLLPALSKARQAAKEIDCVGRFKQVGIAIAQYTGDNEERFPGGYKAGQTADDDYFLEPYFDSIKLWHAINPTYQDMAFRKTGTGAFVCPAAPIWRSSPYIQKQDGYTFFALGVQSELNPIMKYSTSVTLANWPSYNNVFHMSKIWKGGPVSGVKRPDAVVSYYHYQHNYTYWFSAPGAGATKPEYISWAVPSVHVNANAHPIFFHRSIARSAGRMPNVRMDGHVESNGFKDFLAGRSSGLMTFSPYYPD
jgi:type II secretory pathway pseudopilin PulG